MGAKKTTRGKGKSKPSDDTAAFERLLKGASRAQRRYVLKLFITGSSPRSVRAIANIRSMCEEYLPGRYDLEVVDIYQQPTEAKGEQIIAAPTLIRKLPKPARRLVGDLSNRDKVLVGLDLCEEDKETQVASEKPQWLEL